MPVTRDAVVMHERPALVCANRGGWASSPGGGGVGAGAGAAQGRLGLKQSGWEGEQEHGFAGLNGSPSRGRRTERFDSDLQNQDPRTPPPPGWGVGAGFLMSSVVTDRGSFSATAHLGLPKFNHSEMEQLLGRFGNEQCGQSPAELPAPPHFGTAVASSLQHSGAVNHFTRSAAGYAGASLHIPSSSGLPDCSAGLLTDPQTPPRFATHPDRMSSFVHDSPGPASSHFLSASPHFMSSPKRMQSPFLADPAGSSQFLRSPKRATAFSNDAQSAPMAFGSARRLNLFGDPTPSTSGHGHGVSRMSNLANSDSSPFVAELERLGSFGSDPATSCHFVSDLDRLTSFINDTPSSSAFASDLDRLGPLVGDLPSSSHFMSDSERLGNLVTAANPFVGDSESLSTFVSGPESLSTFVGDPQVSGRFECDPEGLSHFVTDSSEMLSDSERFSSLTCDAKQPFREEQEEKQGNETALTDTVRNARLVSDAQACSSRFVGKGRGSSRNNAVTSSEEANGHAHAQTQAHAQLQSAGKECAAAGEAASCDDHEPVRSSDRHSGSNCTLVAASDELQVLDSLASSGDEQEREGGPGVELVDLLLACTQAVSSSNLSRINPLLARLGKLASPEGTSIQRVAAYFTEGLAYRIADTWPQVYQPMPANLELCEDDLLSAYHILNHVCPYTKFSHFSANEAILQVFEGQDRVHVIDFDIQQGLQWPALFQSLASRPDGPPHVRITGIGECKEELQDTGDRLAEFAQDLNLPFEFHAVIDTLEEVRLWMLHVKEKEAVAVNCVSQLHRALHDESGGAIQDVLSVIKSVKPRVVVMVEQEASHNGPFEARVVEALQYYSAVFDSIDSSLPPESEARLKLEQLFAREIRNIVACEGLDRTERHEKMERWRAIFGRGGFQPVPLGHRAASQAKLLLYMFTNQGYRLEEDKGALILNWLDRPLYSVSAWNLVQEPAPSKPKKHE